MYIDDYHQEMAGGGAGPSDNEVGAYADTDQDIKVEEGTDGDNTKENEEDNTN